MKKIFLSLGANIGDRLQTLDAAVNLLKLKNQKTSSIYETEPWGNREQPWFFNLVVSGETELSPRELFKHIQKIEKKLGRKRGGLALRNRPRNIDIDILYYDNLILNSEDLILPHPRILERKFVLTPMREIEPNFIDPVSKRTIDELLKECGDASVVKKH